MSYCTTHMANQRAFSLTELLVVIAVIGLLIGITTPAVMGISRSQKLVTAGQTVYDMVNLGRQVSSTQNRTVEMRIYKIPDETGGNPAFRAVQLFLMQTTGTKALTRLERFPAGVVMSTDSIAGSLLASASDPGFAPIEQKDCTIPLPGIGTAYQYMSFHFLPNGETDLNPAYSGQWCLTLVGITDKIVANNLPSNYVTIRIDRSSGKPTIFQP